MLEAFVAVLVVANVLPILPIVIEFTDGLDRPAQRRVLLEAILVGNLIAAATALLGRALLDATRLTIDDMRIAGGLVLLVFSVFDMLFDRSQRKRPLHEVVGPPEQPALVPLAVPLMVGPAVLATVLVASEHYGRTAALVAVAGNAAINAVLLAVGSSLYARIGGGLGRAIGKVMSLMLAAIAVSMIRVGILGAMSAAH